MSIIVNGKWVNICHIITLVLRTECSNNSLAKVAKPGGWLKFIAAGSALFNWVFGPLTDRQVDGDESIFGSGQIRLAKKRPNLGYGDDLARCQPKSPLTRLTCSCSPDLIHHVAGAPSGSHTKTRTGRDTNNGRRAERGGGRGNS